MISQFYVLSLRGDTIINRDFRGDIVKGTAEIFLRHVKVLGNDAPPIFVRDGITFVFLKRNGLYFVSTTQQNINPSYCLELLVQMTKVFKDFCGVLNEEALRRNFILIYEILDEILDCGYPQHTTTERLKQCIHNDAVFIEPLPTHVSSGRGGLPSFVLPGTFASTTQKTVPSNASHRPVGSIQDPPLSFGDNKVANVLSLTAASLRTRTGGQLRNKNEIFVDILERLTVTMNSVGTILNSSIDGCIQMKSYLAGRPSLRLALNEDMNVRNDSVGRGGFSRNMLASPTALQIDDCNFHESVDLRDFDSLRVLTVTPPEGEFIVMNYRIAEEFKPPFRIHPTLEQTAPNKLELTIDLRADIPPQHYAGNIVLTCPTPRTTVNVSTELLIKAHAQTADFVQQDHKIVWTIRKMQGGSEACLRCRLTLGQSLHAKASGDAHVLTFLRKEIGPIRLMFEIPMFNVSNLQLLFAGSATLHNRRLMCAVFESHGPRFDALATKGGERPHGPYRSFSKLLCWLVVDGAKLISLLARHSFSEAQQHVLSLMMSRTLAQVQSNIHKRHTDRGLVHNEDYVISVSMARETEASLAQNAHNVLSDGSRTEEEGGGIQCGTPSTKEEQIKKTFYLASSLPQHAYDGANVTGTTASHEEPMVLYQHVEFPGVEHLIHCDEHSSDRPFTPEDDTTSDFISAFTCGPLFVAIGFHSGTVLLANHTTGETHVTLHDHKGLVSAVSFCHDCRFVGTAGLEGLVFVYRLQFPHDDAAFNAATRRDGRTTAPLPSVTECTLILNRLHPSPVLCLAMYPHFDVPRGSTRMLAAGGTDGILLLHRLETYASSVPLHAREGAVTSAVWHPSFPILTWANQRGVKLLDVQAEKKISFIPIQENTQHAPVLFWIDTTQLLIGWNRSVRVAYLRAAGGNCGDVVPSGPRASSPFTPYVEILYQFRMQQPICGVAPFRNIPSNPPVSPSVSPDDPHPSNDPCATTSAPPPLYISVLTCPTSQTPATPPLSDYVPHDVTTHYLGQTAMHHVVRVDGVVVVSDSLPDEHDNDRALSSSVSLTFLEPQTLHLVPCPSTSTSYAVSPRRILQIMPVDIERRLAWLFGTGHYEQAVLAAQAAAPQLLEKIVEAVLSQLLTSQQHFARAAAIFQLIDLHSHSGLLLKIIDMFCAADALPHLVPVLPTIPNPCPPVWSRAAHRVAVALAKTRPSALRDALDGWLLGAPDLPLGEIIHEIETALDNTTDGRRIKGGVAADPATSTPLPLSPRGVKTRLLLESLAILLERSGMVKRTSSTDVMNAEVALSRVTDLFKFDETKTLQLLTSEFRTSCDEGRGTAEVAGALGCFPIPKVVATLASERRWLHLYLKALFQLRPELCSAFHTQQISFFAEFDPHELLHFLQKFERFDPKAFNPVHALSVCRRRRAELEVTLVRCRDKAMVSRRRHNGRERTRPPVSMAGILCAPVTDKTTKKTWTRWASPERRSFDGALCRVEESQGTDCNGVNSRRLAALTDDDVRQDQNSSDDDNVVREVKTTVDVILTAIANILTAEVFLLYLLGRFKEALTVLLEDLNDVRAGLEFVLSTRDPQLWEVLMEFLGTRPDCLEQVLGAIEEHQLRYRPSAGKLLLNMSNGNLPASLPVAPAHILRRLSAESLERVPGIVEKLRKLFRELADLETLQDLCLDLTEANYLNLWRERTWLLHGAAVGIPPISLKQMSKTSDTLVKLVERFPPISMTETAPRTEYSGSRKDLAESVTPLTPGTSAVTGSPAAVLGLGWWGLLSEAQRDLALPLPPLIKPVVAEQINSPAAPTTRPPSRLSRMFQAPFKFPTHRSVSATANLERVEPPSLSKPKQEKNVTQWTTVPLWDTKQQSHCSICGKVIDSSARLALFGCGHFCHLECQTTLAQNDTVLSVWRSFGGEEGESSSSSSSSSSAVLARPSVEGCLLCRITPRTHVIDRRCMVVENL